MQNRTKKFRLHLNNDINQVSNFYNYKNWIPGLYHYSNEGEISWFDFANDIKYFCNFKTKINGISTKEYPTAAKRPKYSLLDKTKIKKTYNIKVPYYRESLEKCIFLNFPYNKEL